MAAATTWAGLAARGLLGAAVPMVALATLAASAQSPQSGGVQGGPRGQQSHQVAQNHDADGQDMGRARQRLQELQAQLGQVDNQLALLGKRRQGVLAELQANALRASRARAEAEAARINRDRVQREVQGLNRRKAEILLELDRLRASLRRQIRWLHALGPFGTLTFLPTGSDIEGYLARSRYLDWWRNNETKKLLRARELHDELSTREEEIIKAEARFIKVEAEMTLLQERLRSSERRLREHLAGIQQDEQTKREVQAELLEESILLEGMLSSLLSKAKAEGAYVAPVQFRTLAGRLPRPVAGTLAEGFGVQVHPRFGTKTMNTGLLIAAQGGAPVRAVADGRVVMADSYQSYGLMVIIEHGGSYYSIYTHLRALATQKDAAVKGGETIGYVGDTPFGPRLGFEIRNQTTPEDPQRWLASRYLAAGKTGD